MKPHIITITHEYSSDGRGIGRLVADRLGVPFFDNDILVMATDKSHLSYEAVAELEEKRPSSFLYGLFSSTQTKPINDEVFIAKADVIKKVAQENSSCVIVGSCADYILAGNDRLFRVFIEAPFEQRAEKTAREYGDKTQNVTAMLKRKDKQRADYYNHFTFNKWGDMANYELVVNSKIGIENAVAAIIAALD